VNLLLTILKLLLFAAGMLALGWLAGRTLKRSEAPLALLLKWLLTALTGVVVVWKILPMADAGGESALFALFLMLFCGLFMFVVWRHTLGSIIARPFAALYDGGNEEPEPHPAYSVARSRQKKGQYLEAVAEIRKQLDRFPTDLEGHLLLAQIQAEDMKDLPGAEITIQRLCGQPGHAPRNLAFALYSLADWHLKIGQDREAARRDLEQIIELFPDTEFALGAAQRIAHLGTPEMLLAPHERKVFAVPQGPKSLGTQPPPASLAPTESPPEELAAQYVRQLEQHPLDFEARELLAKLYAGSFGRLDLATDQLEQLISCPGQPPKRIVHWLNLLADFQVQAGADYETARETIQRVIDLDPRAAAAEVARDRLSKLKLEIKARVPTPGVAMGTYEQNIGLNRARRAGGR
jgi:tetratricopeptide (TPR) repeat protein